MSIADSTRGRSGATMRDDDQDGALRADVRRITTLLGYSLARQEGPELLELVEEVRTLTRSDPDAAADLLRTVDETTASQLVRAFNAYFHLANVTEQVHRGRELRRRRAAEGGWLAQTASGSRRPGRAARRARGRGRQAGRPPGLHRPPDRGRPPLDRCTKLRRGRRAARREPPRPRGPAERRPTARLAEIIDLLWQTDELRLRPARAARRGPQRGRTTSTSSTPSAVPDVLEDLADELAGSASSLPADGRAAALRHAGSAATATATRTSPRRSRCEVLMLQHEHGIRARRCWPPWSTSCERPVRLDAAGRRHRGAAGQRWPARPGALPEVEPPLPPHQRRGALPAQGHLHPAAAAEHPGRASRPAPAAPRRAATTSAPPSCVADLELHARLAARAPRRAPRRRAGSTDARPHGRAPSGCTSRPWTCASTPTPTTWRWRSSSTGSASCRSAVRRPAARTYRPALLSAELAGRRPLAPRRRAAGRGRRADVLAVFTTIRDGARPLRPGGDRVATSSR